MMKMRRETNLYAATREEWKLKQRVSFYGLLYYLNDVSEDEILSSEIPHGTPFTLNKSFANYYSSKSFHSISTLYTLLNVPLTSSQIVSCKVKSFAQIIRAN